MKNLAFAQALYWTPARAGSDVFHEKRWLKARCKVRLHLSVSRTWWTAS
jgi:hypothetical protein